MNVALGVAVEADDAPYQQKWFPGVHGSVGGGGERRGLSDRTLDWVLDGARHQGLELDASDHSRIFELNPNYREYLANSPPPAKPGVIDRLMALMPHGDRKPGPTALYEVAISARQRWLEAPENLKDRARYRPLTLERVAAVLDGLDPIKLGIGGTVEATEPFSLYRVKRDDTLGAIALAFYDDAEKWPIIFAANLEKLEDPDRIYVGQSLRIPDRKPPLSH